MGELAYEQRKFFDWGGWLAVRPMDELPHWRVVMRREREPAELDRVPARARTGDRRNARHPRRARHREQPRLRDGDADPHDNYRGRKDSALALYYLWRTGEVMTHHRERFERVYALTETVAPAHLIRESDAASADRFLMTKDVGFAGLAPMRTVGNFMRRKVDACRAGRVAAAQARRRRADRGAG